MRRCLLVLMTGCWANAALPNSGEHIVWGQVTHVEPITERLEFTPPASCFAPKPGVEQGLAAQLAWDLKKHCVAQARTRTLGYRVSYRWDGRTYTQVMDEDPGKRVPLRLKIR